MAAEKVIIRKAEPADTEACARICFQAFGGFHDDHRFPTGLPGARSRDGIDGGWIPHPRSGESSPSSTARIVGSNFLDERDPIRGVGPITVDPEARTRAWAAG